MLVYTCGCKVPVIDGHIQDSYCDDCFNETNDYELHRIDQNKLEDKDRVRLLERKLKRVKEELTYVECKLHTKNKELDAMHYVWCDGGCKYGTHRWTEQNITEEIVKMAERNTLRLKRWYGNNKYRREHYPEDYKDEKETEDGKS